MTRLIVFLFHLLSSIIALLIVLFFSDPFLTKGEEAADNKNYVIIADNGWSIANNWTNYKNIIKQISVEAENEKKEIHFYFSSSENTLGPTVFTSHN